MADRGSMRGRGRGSVGGDRGDRGGGSFRGDRGSGSFRGDRGGGGFRGDRGGGSFRGDRGGPRPPREPPQVLAGKVPDPDVTVTKVEDGGQNNQQATLDIDLGKLALAEKDRSMPPRPAFGTKGKKIILWTNYLQVNLNAATALHRYTIVMNGENKNDGDIRGRTRARIVQLLLEEGSLLGLRRHVATDFKQLLYCTQALESTHMTCTIRFRQEDQTVEDSRKSYVVTMKKTGEYTMGYLLQYLNTTRSSPTDTITQKNDIIQALNIIFGHQMKERSNVLSLGGNRHFAFPTPNNDHGLGGGLQGWRGFLTSVRTGTARILLNVQIKHVAVYSSVRLPDTIRVLFGNRLLSDTDARKLEKYVRLLRVETTHLKTKPNSSTGRIKTILALAKPSDQHSIVPRHGAGPEEVKFHLDEKSEHGQRLKRFLNNGYITVSAFFKAVHGITLDARLPVFNVGTRDKPVYLPAEVCLVVKGQPAKAKLSSDQTEAMRRLAVRKPFDNAKSIIEEGIPSLDLRSSNLTLSAYQVGVGNQLLTVRGRCLTAPYVYYAGNKDVETRNGGWNMANIKFSRSGKSLDRWVVIPIGDGGGNDQNVFISIVNAFHAALGTNGVSAQAPRWTPRCAPREADVAALLRDYADKAQLVLILLPNHGSDEIYKFVKTLCDLELGLHTVCVKGSTIFKKKPDPTNNPQLFANIALKINQKMGGMNQKLNPANLHFIQHGKTMVVGLDVTHPSPGSTAQAKSVAAMVASIDKELSQWPAIISRQPRTNQEDVQHVQTMLKSRLVLWREKNNNALPENILVYRDGVSEGQYAMVLEKELPEMRKACRDTYPATATKNGLPRITIVVVGKRHNTRFYPTTTADADNSSNTKNGTVVDRGVTEAGNWDFFLQAHTALQGTARPAHYFIVLDEILHHLYRKQSDYGKTGFSNTADILEDLTHNMCYMFARATRAISVCPPAYYADLVCERARIYYKDELDPADDASSAADSQATTADREVHQNLRDTMFYL